MSAQKSLPVEQMFWPPHSPVVCSKTNAYFLNIHFLLFIRLKVCFDVAEWIKLKISGQQCETLELSKEDRERIEEIKREMLLKNPIKVESTCRAVF